jgi:hypothetical protein
VKQKTILNKSLTKYPFWLSPLILYVFVLLSGCQKQESNCNCTYGQKTRIENDSFIKVINADDYKMWTTYLDRKDEPLLQSGNQESYRFFCDGTGSFRGGIAPNRVFRIENHNGKYLLHYKLFDRRNGWQRDSLVTQYSKYISEEDWKELKSSISDNCYWTMAITNDRRGLDGSEWALEAFDPNENNCINNKFHIVSRWSPEDTSAFNQICSFFWKYDKYKQ